MLSRTAGYAVHAVVAIGEREAGGRAVPATEVAEALDIPANYLAKILQTLAREGVLTSERGRSGGFRLARPGAEIALMEVVSAFDELGPERRCLLGHGRCSDVGGCPAHQEWSAVSAPAFRFFEKRTVADLMGKPGS